MNQTTQEEPAPSRPASSTAPAAPLPVFLKVDVNDEQSDKPHNSNDRIDINRIPHPPEDNEFKHVSLTNESDFSAVVSFSHFHISLFLHQIIKQFMKIMVIRLIVI